MMISDIRIIELSLIILRGREKMLNIVRMRAIMKLKIFSLNCRLRCGDML